MAYLFRHNWLWLLLAFLIGAIITWFLLNRRERPSLEEPAKQEQPVEEKTLVAAGVATAPAPPQHFEEPPVEESGGDPEPLPAPEQLQFSMRMDDDEPEAGVQVKAEAVPVGRYGEGSADAVAHQGPPDGFTIKGNAQSMLFHTPDSPYYGRTKAEVWFRTEADAERAGFIKYVRKPRKSARPND
ncbi:sunset domain-containing protein [Kribbella sp. NBC_00382]|uniref:sunset domain-containing protein n=1 Tax=Kribbella sp. NBC_00382 TaxID=2975967 RepID=UPI003FA60675